MPETPQCYKPCLSPLGWCMSRLTCDKLLTCNFALGQSTALKIVATKKGARYPYKVVKV